jgi:hypothetical protein
MKIGRFFRALPNAWGKARLSRVPLGKYVILFVSLLHLGWAALLVFSPAAANSTPVRVISDICGGSLRTAFVLAVTAVAAVCFPFIRYTVSNIGLCLMLLPQQSILLMSAGAGIRAAALGRYADGVARPWEFILSDQLPVILLALLYTAVVLEAAFHEVGPLERIQDNGP